MYVTNWQYNNINARNVAQNYSRVLLKQTPLEPPCVSTVLKYSNSEASDVFLVSLAMHSRAVERNEAALFVVQGQESPILRMIMLL